MRLSTGERVFGVCNAFFLGVVALLCLYPFVYTLTMSLSTRVRIYKAGLLGTLILANILALLGLI